MRIDEIKKLYSNDIFRALLDPDKSGKGFVCPFCGSGSGPKGTGLRQLYVNGAPRQGSYKCFNAGCEWAGDGLDLIGGMYRIPDAIGQIKKAEEILRRPLLNENTSRKTERPSGIGRDPREKTSENWPKISEEKTQDNDNKNKLEINYNLIKEIQAEMKQYADNLLNSKEGQEYLKGREISIDTAIKYKLGFCDNYKRDGMNTPAIIYPDGPTSYTARSTTTDDNKNKIRKRKGGQYQDIFNFEILKDASCPPVVYIVEGQADALSIIEAGGQAIATGGSTSANRLKEEISKLDPEKLPCFVLLPDNDRTPTGEPDKKKGYSAAVKIKEALAAAAPPIYSKMINTGDPKVWPADIKDANEYLIKDFIAFGNFISNTTSKVKAELKHMEGRHLGRTSEFLQEFIDKMAGATPPISTGFPALDDLLEGGLHPGLIVIGAISALGKTTYCLNMAENIAAAGKDVLYFSLEMSRYELIAKLISRKTAENCIKEGLSLKFAKSNLGISDYTRYKNYSEAETALIHKCFEDFGNGAAEHLYIKEGIGNIGTESIKKDIIEHINRTGQTPVVFIDYAQIIAPADVRSTDKQNMDKNIVELKRISRDYNTPLVVISSFNRENYTVPVNMSAYKESGALEYTADTLIGLQFFGMDYIKGEREAARMERIRELMEANKKDAGEGKPVKIHLKVLKNRSGRKGDTGFSYYPMFNLYV